MANTLQVRLDFYTCGASFASQVYGIVDSHSLGRQSCQSEKAILRRDDCE